MRPSWTEFRRAGSEPVADVEVILQARPVVSALMTSIGAHAVFATLGGVCVIAFGIVWRLNAMHRQCNAA